MNTEKVIKVEKADIAGWKVTTQNDTYYIGEYGTHHGCYGNEGTIYKDRHAFETGKGVCYINEFGFENEDENAGALFEFADKAMASSEIINNPYYATNGYTRQNLIDLCNGNIQLAEELFDHLDWMAPETLYNEWLDDDEEEQKIIDNKNGGNE